MVLFFRFFQLIKQPHRVGSVYQFRQVIHIIPTVVGKITVITVQIFYTVVENFFMFFEILDNVGGDFFGCAGCFFLVGCFLGDFFDVNVVFLRLSMPFFKNFIHTGRPSHKIDITPSCQSALYSPYQPARTSNPAFSPETRRDFHARIGRYRFLSLKSGQSYMNRFRYNAAVFCPVSQSLFQSIP